LIIYDKLFYEIIRLPMMILFLRDEKRSAKYYRIWESIFDQISLRQRVKGSMFYLQHTLSLNILLMSYSRK